MLNANGSYFLTEINNSAGPENLFGRILFTNDLPASMNYLVSINVEVVASAAVPEPSTLPLAGLSLLALGLTMRRKAL